MDGEKKFMSTQNPFLRITYVRIFLLIISLMGGGVSGQVNWAAYNDCGYETGQTLGDNVTIYGIGDGALGASSGPLLN